MGLIDNKSIDVRYYDKDGLQSLKWVVKDDNITAEEILFEILDTLRVGPVCRYLFGLRNIELDLWLAPNHKINEPLDCDHHPKVEISCNRSFKKHSLNRLKRTSSKKSSSLTINSQNQSTFEISLKFKPTVFEQLFENDTVALDMIWSQSRFNFINKLFIQEKDELFLTDPNILELIVLDIARHLLEKNLSVDDVSNIKIKDFIPKASLSWHFSSLMNQNDIKRLKESIKIAYAASQNDNQLRLLKSKYVEKFITEVAKDHGTDIYQAKIRDESAAHKMERSIFIRVRHNLTLSSYCMIEYVSILYDPKKPHTTWDPICSLDDISFASCEKASVCLNRNNNGLIRLIFNSVLIAKSFLSVIHGYSRLSRKWNMDITDLVWSPTLRNLKTQKIHGPIELMLVEQKLQIRKKIGCFLIRQSYLSINTYYIDILIGKSLFCSICIRHKKSHTENDYASLSDCSKNDSPKSNTINCDTLINNTPNGDAIDDDLSKIEAPSDDALKVGFVKVSHEFWPKSPGCELLMAETQYSTIEQFIQDIQIVTRQCQVQPLVRIRPNENDDCLNLLLCLPESKKEEIKNKYQCQNSQLLDLPVIIPIEKIDFSTDQRPRCSENRMIVRFATLKFGSRPIVYKFLETLANPTERSISSKRHHRKDVLVSTRMNSDQNQSLLFVQQEQGMLLDWTFLKHPYLAQTIGIELSRCALIQERFEEENRLDSYLRSFFTSNRLPVNLSNDTPVQLSEAIAYMESRGITHGKIRCHNIYIKSFDPFRICLTDPLGTTDFINEKAFIPPEIMTSDQDEHDEMRKIYLSRAQPGFDIWAFATTVWQIYEWGMDPPQDHYSYDLQKPRLCSEKTWSLLQSCWHADPNSRPSATAICRDMQAISATFFYPDHLDNDYTMMPEEPTDFVTNGDDKSSTTESSINCSNSAATTTTGLTDPNGVNVVSSTSTLMHTSDQFAFVDDHVCLIDANRLIVESEIGRGSCGVVRRGKLMISSTHNMPVALKYVVDPLAANYRQQVEDLKREHAILKNLEHNNIVRTFGITNDRVVKIVFEYLPLGSLLNFIRNSVNSYTKLPLNKYARDIAHGMRYLESKKIIHRDLALRNVLMKSSSEVKICDFGLAKSLGPESSYRIESLDRAIPWKWCAPETYGGWLFSHKTDVWTYGVVLWEIQSGGQNPQYPGKINMLPKLFREGVRLQRPKYCPYDIYDLMLRCWAFNPEDRPSFELICRDASIQNDYLDANLLFNSP